MDAAGSPTQISNKYSLSTYGVTASIASGCHLFGHGYSVSTAPRVRCLADFGAYKRSQNADSRAGSRPAGH